MWYIFGIFLDLIWYIRVKRVGNTDLWCMANQEVMECLCCCQLLKLTKLTLVCEFEIKCICIYLKVPRLSLKVWVCASHTPGLFIDTEGLWPFLINFQRHKLIPIFPRGNNILCSETIHEKDRYGNAINSRKHVIRWVNTFQIQRKF